MNLQEVEDKYVQTGDLMPEILSMLKIPSPKEIQGAPVAETKHEIVAELFRHKKIRWITVNPERYFRNLKTIYSQNGDNLKFIQSSNNENELYDLISDPGELNNIISQKSSQAAELNQQLIEWRKSFKTTIKNEKMDKRINKKLQDNLRALGYIK